MLKTFLDKYDGIIIDEASLPDNVSDLKNDFISIFETAENKNLIWSKIPIEKSSLIPTLVEYGFVFHHCDESSVTLVKKQNTSATIPTTKNYIAGVGGIVIDNGKILVIKDRFFKGYKLPGGHIDKDESFKAALVREVFEETGVNVEFESVSGFGHFKNGQFGESNLYFVCTARPLSREIAIHDQSEVIDAAWIDVNDFLNSEDVNNFNKSVVNSVITSKDLKLIDRKVKLRVSDGEVFF